MAPSNADSPAAAAGHWSLAGRSVPRLGLGAMRLTGTLPFHAGEPRDRDTSIEVLRRAIELGVRHLDTAAFYFSATLAANDLIATALQPYPEDLVVATKVGPARDSSGEWADRAGPADLRAQVEQNLTELGLDRLPLVSYRSTPGEEITPYVEALAELEGEGLVEAVGVSGIDAVQLDRARAVTEIVAVQNRGDDGAMLHRCGALGLAFVPFFTVSGTGRQGRPEPASAALREVADELGATVAQVRIARTLASGAHVLAIAGTGDLVHLEQNVAAAALRLSKEQLARLARPNTPSATPKTTPGATPETTS